MRYGIQRIFWRVVRWLRQEEEGSVMVIGLMLLAFLTLIGISASTSSRLDVQVSGNDRDYKQNFYLAEAAAMEGAQVLENVTDRMALREREYDWLNANNGTLDMISDDWRMDGSDDNAETSNVDADAAAYAVVDKGPAAGAKGSELGLENPTILHEFSTFGRGNLNDMGVIIVEVGYRKRV